MCIRDSFLCCGQDVPRERAQRLLDAARAAIDTHALREQAGATSPNRHLVLLRALAPMVEPAMDLLRRVRAAWRQEAWQLEANAPRIWAT